MRSLLATKVAASVQTALHSLLYPASCRVRCVSDPALLSGEQTTAGSANQTMGNSEDGGSTGRGTHTTYACAQGAAYVDITLGLFS